MKHKETLEKNIQLLLSKFRLKNYSIEKKLLMTYPILIIISITVVSTFSIYFSMVLFREKSENNFVNLLEQISYNMDVQLKQHDLDTYTFIQNNEVRQFFQSQLNSQETIQLKKNLRSMMTNYLISHPSVDRIVLISNNDDFVSNSDEPLQLTLEDYRQAAAVGSGKMLWMNTQINSDTKALIPMLREIHDLKSLKMNGVLLLFLKDKIFYNNDYKGELMVLDPSGYILSSNNSDHIGEMYIERPMTSFSSNRGSYYDDSGRNFYSYYKSEYTNWIYVFNIPTKELYSGVDTIRNWILLVTLLFTLIGIVLSRIIARNISRPLIDVIKEMRTIESKNLVINVDYEGKDEIAVFTSSFNNMISRINNLISRDSELQRLKHELELRALQAEINPHFLYNTLEAINWIGRINKVEHISEITTKLADIMRYSIDHSRHFVTVQDEYEHIKKYIDIQKVRYGEKLSVFIEIPKEMMNVQIPKLTLQPLVENAIEHGFKNKIDTGKITIRSQWQQGIAVIAVQDNGCGMDQEKISEVLSGDAQTSRLGIGISNVHQRIRLFFGEIYGLEIVSELEKGTKIYIKLPTGVSEHV